MPSVGASRGTAGSPPYRRLPYAAYDRVSEFLEGLGTGALEGSPPRVAATAFENLGPGTRDQVIASLGALGLLEGGRLASTELIRIVRGDAKTRREVLQRRVREVLAGAIELMEAGEPLYEIDRWIKDQGGYSGDTVRRVRSFLLAAIEDLGIPTDLRLYRVRVRRQAQNIGAEPRGRYVAGSGPAHWREARSDEYVGLLIRHLNGRLRQATDEGAAQDLDWLLDRIERMLRSVGPAKDGNGET